ncbi:MAG: TetR/AcrR family transcriptional regulator [Thermodesulfobacteriota bacterium]
MSEKKLHTRVRQEQIVLAALNLVATQGLRSLNVAAVARRIGLVPSAIYRHFKGKEEIIDAVLDHIRGMLQGNVDGVCEEAPDSLERLRRLLFRHIRLIRENLAIPRVIFSEDVYSGRSGRKERVYGIVSDYLSRVEEIIRQGQGAGRIDPGIDPKAVSILFLGLVQPTALLWHISNGRFDVTRQAEKAWKLFTRAVGACCE